MQNIKEIRLDDVRQMLRPRPIDGHKGTFGHALLVSGSKGMAGAAILASESCLRSGIGKLSILTAEENHDILQITVPEAILKTNREWNIEYNAIGIGPGLGINYDLLEDVLQHAQSAMVIDADAVNMLAQKPDWLEKVPQESILTPHPKEAERLIGSNSLEDVSTFAINHKLYIALKGHPTHVCCPSGEIYRLNVGNSGMATAGSGDVLTGIITGLLAQGYSSLESALLGVWLHGQAGDFSSDEMGENCMIARDIIRHLPDAFKKLNT